MLAILRKILINIMYWVLCTRKASTLKNLFDGPFVHLMILCFEVTKPSSRVTDQLPPPSTMNKCFCFPLQHLIQVGEVVGILTESIYTHFIIYMLNIHLCKIKQLCHLSSVHLKAQPMDSMLCKY